MNRRTTLLLSVMLIMIGAWVCDQLGLLAFLDSKNAGESELDKISRQITKAEDIILQGTAAADALLAFEKRSLPYDPAEARSAYQSWLTRLVEENQIQRSTVEVDTPDPVSIKDGAGKSKVAYQRYGFTVSGVGRLDNVTAPALLLLSCRPPTQNYFLYADPRLCRHLQSESYRGSAGRRQLRT